MMQHKLLKLSATSAILAADGLAGNGCQQMLTVGMGWCRQKPQLPLAQTIQADSAVAKEEED